MCVYVRRSQRVPVEEHVGGCVTVVFLCYRLRPPPPGQRSGPLRRRRVPLAHHRHRLHHEVPADEHAGGLPAGEGASSHHQPEPQLHGPAARVGAVSAAVDAGPDAVFRGGRRPGVSARTSSRSAESLPAAGDLH